MLGLINQCPERNTGNLQNPRIRQLAAWGYYDAITLYHIQSARYCDANAVTVLPHDTRDGFSKCSSASGAS